VRGHKEPVVGGWARKRFTTAEGHEVGNHLLGKKSQFRVGLLGPPPEHLEGGLRIIDAVDEHEHAFGLLDDCPVLGDEGDGGGYLVLVFLLRGGGVRAVGAAPVDHLQGLGGSALAVAIAGWRGAELIGDFLMLLHRNTPLSGIPFCDFVCSATFVNSPMAYGAVHLLLLLHSQVKPYFHQSHTLVICDSRQAAAVTAMGDGQRGNASVLTKGMNPDDRLAGDARVIPRRSSHSRL
jgi:hypothetical protein